MFNLAGHQTTLKREIVSGVATFLAMSYILFVNPMILKNTGMDPGALFTVTVISAIFANLLMAFFVNWPFALAPGMGSNALFTYFIVLGMGIPWTKALAVVFVSGSLMVLLTVSKFRSYIVQSIPKILQQAIGIGIGAFLIFLGLKQGGLIVSNPNTLLSLGNLGELKGFSVLLGILLIFVLDYFKIIGSTIISIIILSVIGFIAGESHYEGIISLPQSVAPLMGKLDFSSILDPKMFGAIFTLFIIDFFDTTMVFTGLTSQFSKTLDQKKMSRGLFVDGLSTVFGSWMGTSTVTTYSESAVGIIQAGGRTGLSTLVVALLFVVAMFFSPLISLIPGFAVAPALVYVGALMFHEISNLSFKHRSELIPAVLTILMMPLTFSIIYGVMFGMLTWAVLNCVNGNYFKKEFLKQHWIVPVIALILVILAILS